MDIGYLKTTPWCYRENPHQCLSASRQLKIMETHVLIPPELMLKVRPSSQSPAVAKLLEQHVTVVANVELPKGRLIYPTQGTVRCGKLDIYSTLSGSDVRTILKKKITTLTILLT